MHRRRLIDTVVHRHLHGVTTRRSQRRTEIRAVDAPRLRRRPVEEPCRPRLNVQLEPHDTVGSTLTVEQLGDPQWVVERG